MKPPDRFDSPWRSQCIKHAIFFTDNVPGGCDDDYVCEIDEANALTRARQAGAAGIMITSVYVGGFPSASPGIERIMRRYAVMTSGAYVPVSVYATGPDGMSIAEVLQAVVGLCPDCNENGINDLLDVAPGGGSLDCNTNSVPDECEPDCNSNGIPDSCDILTGMSLDVNTNAHPDECEVDCNNNGILDVCENDCNGNAIPDECEVPPIGSRPDCNGNYVPDECEPDCDDDGIPDDCELPPYGSSLDCNDNDLPDECEEDCNGNTIPDDCDVRDCAGTPPPIFCADCNSNGIPDSCDRDAGWPDLDCNDILDDCEDCNTNSIPDTCDLSCVAPGCFGIPGCGQDTDLNHNGLPDSCEDCNDNGMPDDLDLILGTSQDCNGNAVPDECDIADCPRLDPACRDCNANDVPDSCDLTAGTSEDCNHNQVPDECDIADCLSWEWRCRDCDDNGIPDECDLTAGREYDCNENHWLDPCDIAVGRSVDCQSDGVPDKCQISLFQTEPDPPYYCNPYLTTCSPDLDVNGVPDECQDCNDNSLFDPCEIWCRPYCDPENCGFASEMDCSSNGIPDDCDVDCNDNDVPDTCECFYGDFDRDGDSDLFDFAAFQNCVNANGGPVSFECDCAFDLYPLAGGPGIGDDDTTAADHPFYEAYLAGTTGGPHTPCWAGHPYAPLGGGGLDGLDGGGETQAADGMGGESAMPAMCSVSEDDASTSESDGYATPAPLTLELRPVQGGDPVTVLTAHTTYEVRYTTTLAHVNDVVLFGVARSREQGLTSAGRAQMSDWCVAETFYFHDILADGCEPVPVGWAPEGFARYQLVVGDLWSAVLGAASEAESAAGAGPRGLLCTITTGEPGLLYLEMYLTWIDPGTDDYEESYGHAHFEVKP